MKPIQDILPELLRKRPQKELPLEDIVRAAWAHLVGRHLAARSEVFRLYRETLIVHVPDRTWQRQLLRLERKLLGRINHLLGRTEITSLDFRVDPALAARAPAGQAATAAEAAAREAADVPRKGPVREVAPATRSVTLRPAASADDAGLEESARAIADPGLRELFLRTSRKMMR